MRDRGSAIIIAFFLMAAISGITFAIARLFYLDTSASDIYENSSIAYYAAESGVEEGLLRYRFDRQSEVGTADAVNRTNLNDRTVSSVAPNTSLSSITDANKKSIFDLRMSYKASFYGNEKAALSDIVLDGRDLASADYGDEYLVPRDESVKIDITDAIGADVKLFVLMQNFADQFTGDKDKSFIEARVVGTSGGEQVEEKRALVTNTSTTGFSSAVIQMQPSPGCGSNCYEKENLITWIFGSGTFDTQNNQRVFLYLKPIGCDIIIGLAPSTGSYISAPYTLVKSTGYYGGISRTLEAKIDRQSGTVYDLFDFVTYQHP